MSTIGTKIWRFVSRGEPAGAATLYYAALLAMELVDPISPPWHNIFLVFFSFLCGASLDRRLRE